MKKIILMAAFVAISTFSFGQAQKYLNVGGLGTGLYASIEFPITSVITVAPQVSTDYNFDKIVIAGKGNFYFDDIFGIGEAWDVYAGANVGYRIETNNDGFNWGTQIGGRWFWSDKWGINGEFGGGSGNLGGIGVTMKM